MNKNPHTEQGVIGNNNIFSGTGNVNVTYNLPPTNSREYANLLILLNKVKQFWIEGVLEKSLYHEVLIELGKELRLEDIEHPWERVLELPEQDSKTLPPDKKIADIFAEVGRSLLILGEPGAGKTITLLELARSLINRAENDPSQPIPVVFNLSSWAEESLLDWMVKELKNKYYIPKKLARNWLENQYILPLLDGLDEVKAEYRVGCLEAINEFASEFGLNGLVVCSRLKEYTDLQTRLKFNGAICLQPLSSEQVDGYLKADTKLAALQTLVQLDEDLQTLAKSPLMLNIMTLAYQDLPIEAIEQEKFDTLEERRTHLFDSYIDRMFKRKGKAEQPYTKQQVVDGLSWLAQKMKQHGQSIFLIENLQPSWLDNKWQLWGYGLGSRVVGSLISAIIFILPITLIFLPNIIEYFTGKNPSFNMTDRLIIGTILGLIGIFIYGLFQGLFLGISDILRFRIHEKKFYTSWKIVIYYFFRLLFFLIIILSIIQYLFLFVFGLRNRKRKITNDIQMVGKVNLFWLSALKGSILWGNIGIFFTLFVHSITNPDKINWGITIIIVSVFFILGAIYKGLHIENIDKISFPTQGIKSSLKSMKIGAIIGILTATIFGSMSVLLGVMAYKPSIASTFIDFTTPFLFIATLLVPIMTLWYGGMDIIQHYTLRYMLYFKNNIICKFIPFLDHATNFIFLQRIGGGYIFIHRLLLEHFALAPKVNIIDKKSSTSCRKFTKFSIVTIMVIVVFIIAMISFPLLRYQIGAKMGSSIAQNELGFMYHHGQGLEKNYEKAINFYKLAANQNNVDAQNNLGMLLYYENNYQEAAKWFEKAVKNGHSNAQNYLGFMYRHGQGVEQDYEKAVNFYELAANQNNVDAQYNLGMLYYEVVYHGKHNYLEADKWIEKAANNGHINAQNELGNMYYDGYIFKKAEISAHVGELLWVSGDKTAAKEVWEKAIQDFPDNKLLKEVWQKFVVTP